MTESLDYQYFHKYFSNFTDFNAKSFDLAVEHVYQYANENGLSEDDLILLARVAFNQKLGTTRVRKVLRCLIPRRSVPDEVVESVLDWFIEFYNQDISIICKKIILQWFIGSWNVKSNKLLRYNGYISGLIQYNLINPAKTIRSFYDLYWYFLPYETINVQACHLIYLLAKPEDVNRWYVKQILKVHEQFNKPKYTGALLLLFKSYRPDCVPENIDTYAVHKAFGVLPEFITNNFGKAQEKLESSNINLNNPDDIFWYNTISKNIKKKSVQLIPNITESETNKLDGGKLITSITDAKDLCKYIIIENSPNRILSLLNNKEGRFILIFGGQKLHERFSFQLYYALYNAFFERDPNVPHEEKDNLLKAVSILQNQLQQYIPVVSKFLAQFIVQWDGIEHEEHIYSLLEWLNINSFDELHECILTFLYTLFVSGTVERKCKILKCIARIAINILHTFHYRQIKGSPLLFLNEDIFIRWEFNDLIFNFYDYIVKLMKLGWTLENGHSLIMLTLIEMNLMISETEKKCELEIWKTPDFIFKSGLFTANPIIFRNIFRYFNRFPSHIPESLKKDYLNSLVSRRAFVSKDEKSVYNIFSENQVQKLREYSFNINEALSFENHLALKCYNYDLKQGNDDHRNNFEKCVERYRKYCPELLEFLGRNVNV